MGRRPVWIGNNTMTDGQPFTPEAFEAELRVIGKRQYHDLHPFHQLLHGGELKKGQVQAWALNRFYYQISIPRKDLALMSRIEDPELRNTWRQRVLDHREHHVGLESTNRPTGHLPQAQVAPPSAPSPQVDTQCFFRNERSFSRITSHEAHFVILTSPTVQIGKDRLGPRLDIRRKTTSNHQDLQSKHSRKQEVGLDRYPPR